MDEYLCVCVCVWGGGGGGGGCKENNKQNKSFKVGWPFSVAQLQVEVTYWDLALTCLTLKIV